MQQLSTESRFRMIDETGGAYILTRAMNGGWQLSHYHKNYKEILIVQKGWAILSLDLNPGMTPFTIRISPGEMKEIPVGMRHNVFMSPGAVTHCVKVGNVSQFDKYYCPEFDEITNKIKIDDEGVII